MRPVSFWTSFLVCRGCIGRIAFILSGLASMPLVETQHPRTLPLITLNTHFCGLSLSLALHILAKVSAMSEI
jgi:hypothetical protein